MSSGQTRVIVLLIILLALEIVVHPDINTWLQSAQSFIGNALQFGTNNIGGQGPPPAKVGPPTFNNPNIKDTNPDGSCPPGYSLVIVAGGKRVCQKN